MEWTTEEPTKEGYYWAWEQYYDFPACKDKVLRVCLVRVGLYTLYRDTRLFAFEGSSRRPLFAFSHWIGPLEPPSPPIDYIGDYQRGNSTLASA